MQMTYDSTTDALYIQLTTSAVVRSQQINPNFALDLDENGAVIGIEMLNVRKSGIDPSALEILHTTPGRKSNALIRKPFGRDE